MKLWKKIFVVAIAVTLSVMSFAGCDGSAADGSKEKVVIYTSIEDYCVDYMKDRLKEEFPQYNVVVEYKSTGDHAAALKGAGTKTECDIFHNLEYAFSDQIADLGYFADLTDLVDTTPFVADSLQSPYYIPQGRSGGCIAVNTARLEEMNLKIPTCYADLLDPAYKDLISMPSPASSSTGYMFLLTLVKTMGREEALAYFDKLSENILAYTPSGSGPATALANGEVAIGLALNSDVVAQINEGFPIKILEGFEGGSPYTLYSQGIIAGKQERAAVREVFAFVSTTLTEEICERYYPEKIFKDKDYTTENYPKNIEYADMAVEDPGAYKEALLKEWKH